MRESALERKLKTAVESVGGEYLKFTSPGRRGVPDRICLFKNARIAFVELKAPGGKLHPLQDKCKRVFENLGFQVWVIDSEIGIRDFVEGFR
ncbi:VRR-NUC domain-containing protein [Brevibacillus laterosporus]|uniref:VRR-NUC domain-containing protein n=1 Tax=Brevibacillus laterosporus TaxID=1465 RepID=UPI00195CFBD9|nr:VRR-NUC domain-containing protein [Brevibacillus laterosporus]